MNKLHGDKIAERIVEMYSDKEMTLDEISKDLNITIYSVRKILINNDVKIRKKGAKSKEKNIEESENLRRWREEGLIAYTMRENTKKWSEIGDHFGISKQAAYQKSRNYARQTGRKWPIFQERNPSFFSKIIMGKNAYFAKLDADPPITWKSLAESLGVDNAIVILWAKKYAEKNGLKWPIMTTRINRINEYKESKKDEWKKMYLSGMSHKDIANTSEVSHATIRLTLMKMGVKSRPKGKYKRKQSHA